MCRFEFGTSCYQREPEFECDTDSMSYCICGLLPLCQVNSTLCEQHVPLSNLFMLMYLLAVYGSNLIISSDAGDNVQRACYAVPFGGECYAFVALPSIQVSLQGLGQYCSHCLLFHSWHCRTLVIPTVL
jgi:hypothetical protein